MSAPAALPGEARLTPSEQVALARLTRAASIGAICPNNDELADAIGAASVSTASSVVASLARKGVIELRRFQQARQVTIVATKRSTAMPAHARPHWRDRTGAAPSERELAKGRLADAMADGAPSLVEAARRLRQSRSTAFALWSEIRAGLGPQAI